ncbi:TetR/AcrR family transcriptional regulator [Staphylococcus sp. EZ-P03]|uniref:TetR/AcrR family transcriptional regulator n=1 Tax=Staphylococcus sp. EZ-P03 TaxID=2282739 RepID=UPI000DF7D546|nr:TetR/AcrR family transcriptional regulator [Staphylococcus sp. EZ-P03]
MPYARKTNQTKRKIKEALIQLMKQTHFDLIAIHQIAEAAGITRSTFYRYYDDKYELLEEIEDEVIQRLNELRKQFKSKSDGTEFYEKALIKEMFDALYPYADTIHLLLSFNTHASFEMKLKNDMKQRFDIIRQNTKLTKVERDLLKEYIFNMFITTFKYWAGHKEEVTSEEVADIIIKVQWNGFKNILEDSQKQHR